LSDCRLVVVAALLERRLVVVAALLERRLVVVAALLERRLMVVAALLERRLVVVAALLERRLSSGRLSVRRLSVRRLPVCRLSSWVEVSARGAWLCACPPSTKSTRHGRLHCFFMTLVRERVSRWRVRTATTQASDYHSLNS